MMWMNSCEIISTATSNKNKTKKQDPYVNGTEGVCLKICMEYGITTSHRKFEGAIQDKLR